VIRAAGLAAALARGLPLAGAALETDRDPALLRLAEQSGCGGRPLGYVTGYFGAADPASGVFWCDRHAPPRLSCPSVIVAIDAADGAVGEGAWLVRVHH
jgi:hypothetical protein